MMSSVLNLKQKPQMNKWLILKDKTTYSAQLLDLGPLKQHVNGNRIVNEKSLTMTN